MNTCATCKHWAAADRATVYQAPCARGMGSMPWDGGCREHEAPKVEAPTLGQQSQTRGDIPPIWRQYLKL